MESTHHKTLFLSDIHLGSKGCQAELLIDFLRQHEAEKIYLVGDIVDGWRLKRGWYWPQPHNDVVQKLLRKARKGTEIIYVPGNHDEFLRGFFGSHFGGVEVRDRDMHETADGRKLLIIHGDQFDVVVRHAKWLAHLGDWAYVTALAINTWVNRIRRTIGLPYWSLSKWAKMKVKDAVNFIGEFERALAREANEVGADGVVCGHIHHAVIAEREGIQYINTGDWVESCTAIVEAHDGTLSLIDWAEVNRTRMLEKLRANEQQRHGESGGKRPARAA